MRISFTPTAQYGSDDTNVTWWHSLRLNFRIARWRDKWNDTKIRHFNLVQVFLQCAVHLARVKFSAFCGFGVFDILVSSSFLPFHMYLFLFLSFTCCERNDVKRIQLQNGKHVKTLFESSLRVSTKAFFVMSFRSFSMLCVFYISVCCLRRTYCIDATRSEIATINEISDSDVHIQTMMIASGNFCCTIAAEVNNK